jgi:hypothetical protein
MNGVVLHICFIVGLTIKLADNFHHFNIVRKAHDQHEETVQDDSAQASLLQGEVSDDHVNNALFAADI